MSVLYQALKRRDEAERGALPGGVLFSPAPPAARNGWKFAAILAILAALGVGFYAYTAQPPQNAPVASLPLPPVHVPAEPPPQLADGATPANVDIEQIAALMPDDAKVPLPSSRRSLGEGGPPVKVGTGPAASAVQQRARELQAQGATGAAIKLYAQTGNDFSSRVNRWGLVAETEPQRALPHLQALVRERPDSAAAHAQLGLAYIALNRAADAESELTAATALDPTNAQIWYNLAALTDQLGRSNMAQTAYENTLLYAGNAPPFDRAAVQARLNYLRSR